MFQCRFIGFVCGDTREWICVSIALSSGWLCVQLLAVATVVFGTLEQKLPVDAIFALHVFLFLLCILVAVVIAASFAFFWFETRKQKKRAEKNKEAAVTSEPGTSKSDKLGVG